MTDMSHLTKSAVSACLKKRRFILQNTDICCSVSEKLQLQAFYKLTKSGHRLRFASLLTCIAISVCRIPGDRLAQWNRWQRFVPGQRLESEETAVCCTALETIPLRSALQERLLCSGILMLLSYTQNSKETSQYGSFCCTSTQC